MNTKEIEELNIKLLKFAGFNNIHESQFNKGKYIALYPKDSDVVKEYGHDIQMVIPDLVTSLDAQAKNLYPKIYVTEINYGIYKPKYTGKYVGYIEDENRKDYMILNENPAIAFALAVEKYIDSEVKDK